MPDNGFGAKTNSGDFLLRLYRIRPDFETEEGGDGTVDVESFIQLRDPNRKIRFGKEFGPFVLHTDETGKVLNLSFLLSAMPSKPRLAGRFQPSGSVRNGFCGDWTPGSVYPVLEGALRNDPDPRRRIVNEFDLPEGITRAAPGTTGSTQTSPTP
jgi:hypothetical protein